MVFIGGWRPRRRRYGYYSDYGPPRGRGYGGSSCGRDLCLLESGCCLADLLGCGPQLALSAPTLLVRSTRAARLRPSRSSTGADGADGADGAESGDGGRPTGTARVVLAAIDIYQREISPTRPAACRYTPTCSAYAAQAVRSHGMARGSWLAARRLVRCRPGTKGGEDPVPPPPAERSIILTES